MSTPTEIPFQDVVNALLDADTPLNPRFLYRLSDLERAEMALIEQVWPQIPAWRRKGLLEDVQALCERDTLLSFEALAGFALSDADPAVRLPAVRTLYEFEEDDFLDDFMRMLQSDPDEQVRAAVAAGLGKFIYMGEIEALDEALLRQVEELLLQTVNSDQPILVRRRALESLGFSGRDEVPALIQNAFASGSHEWLISALFAMGRSANERWHPQVLGNLDNAIADVRAEAARAAGELEIQDAIPRLIELLEDTEDMVRKASIWSLSQIGGEGVREALETMYEETEDDEEAELLEAALDNLAFTEDMQLIPLFDFPQGDVQLDSDEDYLDEIEEDEDSDD
jgi:HEAT repeat protein